jgi:hypothetical protein
MDLVRRRANASDGVAGTSSLVRSRGPMIFGVAVVLVLVVVVVFAVSPVVVRVIMNDMARLVGVSVT